MSGLYAFDNDGHAVVADATQVALLESLLTRIEQAQDHAQELARDLQETHVTRALHAPDHFGHGKLERARAALDTTSLHAHDVMPYDFVDEVLDRARQGRRMWFRTPDQEG